MEPHFNTFAASTGLLGNLIQACLTTAAFLENVAHADELAMQFTARLQLYLSRLHWWSVRWKLMHDERSPHEILDARFHMYGNAIANYLELILHTVHHLTSQQDRIPILQNTRSAQAFSASERFAKLLNTPWKEYSGSSTSPTVESSSNLAERLRWALKSGPAMQRLQLLDHLIRDLELFLPPPGLGSDMSGAVLVNPALMTEQGDWGLRWLSRQTEMDPFAASLAWLKASVISDLTPSSDSNLQRLDGMLLRNPYPRAARHYTGHYNGTPVLIEKKTVPSKVNHKDIKPRIEKVVHLLKASQKIQELRTLPCIGYIYTQPGEGSPSLDDENRTYELIYTIHAGPVLSLRDMLNSDSKKGHKYKPELSLDKRFEIARKLARALLYLHAAEWLHKGIRSSNIVFVPSSPSISNLNEAQTCQFGPPYLVGFEYSRPASNSEGTENHPRTLEDNLYRHPNAQGLPTDESYIGKIGHFTKDYDIYSLGITLVEMGTLSSVGQMAEDFKKKRNCCDLDLDSFLAYLTKTVIPRNVAFRKGEIYAKVALRCLRADFYSLPGRSHQDGSIEFYKEVVSQLETCRA